MLRVGFKLGTFTSVKKIANGITYCAAVAVDLIGSYFKILNIDITHLLIKPDNLIISASYLFNKKKCHSLCLNGFKQAQGEFQHTCI